jgi:hypothetical protein
MGSQFHHGHVSGGPPIIPDSRISQVRFETLACPRRAFPSPGETEALVRIHPCRRGLPTASFQPSGGVDCRFYQADHPAGDETAKCPEPLCPTLALPPLGRCAPSPRKALPFRPRSYGLMRPSRAALSSFGFSPRTKSLCRLLPAPAAPGMFPTLSPRIFPAMPDPLPRRSHTVRLPVASRVSSAFPAR